MTYNLVADFTFVCTDPKRDTDDAFDAFTDAVTDALFDLEDVDEGITDPDTTAVITERSMSILVGIDADTLPDAVRLYSANVRTALHAAGCATPDWPAFKPIEKRPAVREADFAGA